MYTRYEAMNSGANAENGVVWGGMGTQGHGQFETAHTTSYPTLIETISYHVRDLASYLSKVADFIPPHLYLAPPEGVNPVEFLGDRCAEKTRVLGLSCGVVCVSLHLAVLVQFRLVTDRLIQDHSIYRASIASRSKQNYQDVFC